MIRAYDEYGNIIDLVEWEKKIRSKDIDDFANVLKENYDYLPQILSQESFGIYIDEYAEQLKAGGNIELSEYSKSKGNRTGK